ncbi:MAG: KilA-N domain-containing protein [Vicingaceae bacterium]|nr:KilA-N domain-containing protein [Vicingaceae bacterium]
MAKNKKIEVKGREISLYSDKANDYISLTDIAKHKDAKHTDSIIQNWMRNRNTVELLGFWEQLYNSNFKPLEFEGLRKQAGLNSFVLTPKRWIETTNAIGVIFKLINQGLKQPNRLQQLNEVAIAQMTSLLNHKSTKKLI